MSDLTAIPVTTNIIDEVEASIVARLLDRLPGRVTRIEAFPDRPEDYDFPNADKAACFVRYAKSDFSPANGGPRAVYATHETLHFEVVSLTRALRRADSGPIGAYELLDEIRRALQGRSVAGATPLMQRGRRLDGERNGVWRWISTFSCAAPAVAEGDFAPGYLIAPGGVEARAGWRDF